MILSINTSTCVGTLFLTSVAKISTKHRLSVGVQNSGPLSQTSNIVLT